MIHYGAHLVDEGKTVHELSQTLFAAVTLHDLYKIVSDRGILELSEMEDQEEKKNGEEATKTADGI